MQDCNDWPVTFLGAMLAGVVPVAVNTLMTADDCAYMLEHSRAQAAFVSGALKPVLKAALTKSDHEVHKVIVSRPAQPLEFGEAEFEAFLDRHAPLVRPAPTRADDPAFWLYSSGSTGRPKGTVHSHANPYWTTELYGKAILGLREDDVCFSGGQALLRLWARQCFDLSPRRRRDSAADGRSPDARRSLQALDGRGRGREADGLLRRADRLRRHARLARSARARRGRAPRSSRRRARRCRPRSASASSAHFGVDIVDGIGSTEMLHIFISNRPDEVRYGTTGWPVPGYDIELRGEDGGPGRRTASPGDLYIHGPSAAIMYWGNREQDARDLSGRLDQERRQIHPQCRRLA